MILESKSGPVEITADTITALRSRWRGRDVDAALAAAHLWLLEHPTRRPVNIYRFLRNWFAKAPMVMPQPMDIINRWWATDNGTLVMGQRMGVHARPGESLQDYRTRIGEAIVKAREAA